MSAAESTPDRTIGGLAPRRSTFDASRLIAANRRTASPPPAAPPPKAPSR